MPPRKAIPEGFSERASDGKVLCKTCKGDWLARASIPAHLKSNAHVDSARAVAAATKANQAADQFYLDDAQEDLDIFELQEPVLRPAIDIANNPYPVAQNPLSTIQFAIPIDEPTQEELSNAQAMLDAAQARTVQEFERRYAAVMQTLTQDLRGLYLRVEEPEEDEDDATIASVARDLRQQGRSHCYVQHLTHATLCRGPASTYGSGHPRTTSWCLASCSGC